MGWSLLIFLAVLVELQGHPHRKPHPPPQRRRHPDIDHHHDHEHDHHDKDHAHDHKDHEHDHKDKVHDKDHDDKRTTLFEWEGCKYNIHRLKTPFIYISDYKYNRMKQLSIRM